MRNEPIAPAFGREGDWLPSRPKAGAMGSFRIPHSAFRIGGDYVAEDVVEGASRPPADQAAHLVQRRDAATHVLEAAAVRLLVGQQANLGGAAGQRLDAPRQLKDGDLLLRADV